jgi:hypothetical protein
MRTIALVLLLLGAASSSFGEAPPRHGLLVKVWMRSFSEDPYKPVGVMSDAQSNFTFRRTAPDRTDAMVFRMTVVPTGHCEAQLTLTPLAAVNRATPSLPTTITPGATIEFETLNGWDDRTYFRLVVVPGRSCKRTTPT